MWIKDLIEDILSPVYPGIDLQEVRSVGVNRLDNDGILPVYATSDSDRQALNELVEQEGRELNTEVQQLVFIRGDFGRFLQLFGTDPVLLDWDGNNFTIEFNVARWPDWFSIKIINEDITMPINTPIYLLDTTGQAVAAKKFKEVFTLLDAVTTNQTSAAVAIPKGPRTIQASIAGTGAVSGTVTWYGTNSNEASGGILLATSTLSGTTTDTTGAEITAEWPYIYCTLAGISGTGAAVTASVGA